MAEGHAFTFIHDDSLLVFPIRGIEVVPFWSSKARLDAVQKQHPKYQAYAQDALPLDKFLNDTLVQLEDEKLHVGVNWSGKRLTGYDVTVADLRRNLAYWFDRKALQ